MIMFWNRKEVYVGFSMKSFGEIRDILSANGIKYTYKVININSSSTIGSSRVSLGSLGEKPQLAYEYYVYVNKNDYDNAYGIINQYLIENIREFI